MAEGEREKARVSYCRKLNTQAWNREVTSTNNALARTSQINPTNQKGIRKYSCPCKGDGQIYLGSSSY